MEQYGYYRIVPTGPLHFGERGTGLEETASTLHSDSLFAAIVAAWRILDGPQAIQERLQGFPTPENPTSEPPFVLSSTFPYVGDVLFLPRPLVSMSRKGRQLSTRQWKQVRYVSIGRMLDIIQQRGPASRIERDELLQEGALWATKGECNRLRDQFREKDLFNFRVWQSGDNAMVPRVTVDRITSASAVYFCGRILFHEGCGLYCLVRYNRANYQSYVERALCFLADAGIGGRRNQGYGQFRLEPSPNESNTQPSLLWRITMPKPQEANAALLLSLYHPTLAEAQAGLLQTASYQLLFRRGWIGSPDDGGKRRLSLCMLAEGAVLPNREQEPIGDVVDLRPAGFPHPVYRSGLAFTIPFARQVPVREV
jgi:CRISPR-associated protein Csm4